MEQVRTRGVYCEVTHNIRVSVKPVPLVEESNAERGVYAFAYTVTIENLGTNSAQLLERHWIINSAENQIAEVVGPGVVGEQPQLSPGQSFEYTSSAVIHDPIGSMHGTYTFRGTEGAFFDVLIPQFDLIYPMMLH